MIAVFNGDGIDIIFDNRVTDSIKAIIKLIKNKVKREISVVVPNITLYNSVGLLIKLCTQYLRYNNTQYDRNSQMTPT